MNELVETHEHLGWTIKVFTDDNPSNPRTEWDNAGTMTCFHKRYNLGDETDLCDSQFSGWQGLSDYLIKECGAKVILPLYLYDHSGITMSTGKFDCPWDSGQVGFIWISKEKILKEWGKKKLTKKCLEKAEACLRNEVKVYDHYLTCAVYGYVVETPDGEEVDSCWGYYGDAEESGLLEAAKNAIEYELAQRGFMDKRVEDVLINAEK